MTSVENRRIIGTLPSWTYTSAEQSRLLYSSQRTLKQANSELIYKSKLIEPTTIVLSTKYQSGQLREIKIWGLVWKIFVYQWINPILRQHKTWIILNKKCLIVNIAVAHQWRTSRYTDSPTSRLRWPFPGPSLIYVSKHQIRHAAAHNFERLKWH